MAEQTYQPYRSTLLSRDELRDLYRLSPARVLIDIALLWGQILAAWAAAAWSEQWWVYVLAAMFVGNRYYSLFIIGHDGLHRRLADKVTTNDLVNDAFVLGPIGAITRVNRRNHMAHHAGLATASDPDAYKFAARTGLSSLAYSFSLTGVPFVLKAVGNVFGGGTRVAAAGERYTARDVLILAIWQAALLYGLTRVFGWWGYIAMWWAPVYVFTFVADLTRVFCEHSADERADPSLADRLVTFEASKLELALFAPKNMNCHTAHHLWPAVPYYNLPRASEMLHARLERHGTMPATSVRVSYWRYLRNYLSAGARP